MPFPFSLLRWFLLPGISPAPRSALLVAGLALVTGSASAQALNTADRPSELTVFAGGAFSSPHFGPGYNTGISAGAEFVRYLHFPVAPGFLARADYTSGDQQDERSILFGLSARLRLGNERIRPYASGFVGVGTLTFKPAFDPNYPKDTGTVYSGGGGVEIDVTRRFRTRFDYQQQRWNFGPDSPTTTFLIHPWIGTASIVYQIPFRPLIRHGDEQRDR